MTTYATKTDIDDLYGPDLLKRIADQDKDGVPDVDVVERGLEAADDTINAYLSSRYTLPLPITPGIVRDCAIDIAVYKMALQRAARTDEMRVRYEDALALLEKIATGKAGLGIAPTDLDGNGTLDDERTNIGRSVRSYRTF